MGTKADNSIDTKLKELDASLEALKALYDQYFVGLIRRPPLDEQDRWLKSLQSIAVNDLPTAPYKFRYRNIKSRYQSYLRLWEKTSRAIEEGTYKRELQRVSKKTKAPPPAEAKPASAEKRAIEKLYLTLSEKIGAEKKLPDRLKFETQMEAQIKRFKENNPNQAFQFKLSKDKMGQVQIKITPKQKAIS